jgi:hypothetical protein
MGLGQQRRHHLHKIFFAMPINLIATVAVVAQLATGNPLANVQGLFGRKEEPCKQVRDAVARWISDNHIGTSPVSGVLRTCC